MGSGVSGFSACRRRVRRCPVARLLAARHERDQRVGRGRIPVELDVLFYAKREGKSQVSVDQRKLPHAEAVERARAFWRERLGRLKALLEG